MVYHYSKLISKIILFPEINLKQCNKEDRKTSIWTRFVIFTHKRSTTDLDVNADAAKSLQSCLTLCDPIDGSTPGSSIPGILQARLLEWVAISFSNAWKWNVKGKSLSHVRLFRTPWTAAYQAPPSMGFSRKECWSSCHCLLRWMLIPGCYLYIL